MAHVRLVQAHSYLMMLQGRGVQQQVQTTIDDAWDECNAAGGLGMFDNLHLTVQVRVCDRCRCWPFVNARCMKLYACRVEYRVSRRLSIGGPTRYSSTSRAGTIHSAWTMASYRSTAGTKISTLSLRK
eukprot:SAG11_NODE_15095_length_589_cov_1.155102_2_plen_127_part_01